MTRIITVFHNLSIRKKMTFSYAVLVIVPILALMLISMSIITNMALEKINNANKDAVG